MKKIERGFTLLELLIAVTIFSIIALAMYSSFYSGIRILRRTQEIMKFHQEIRLATEEVALDLRNTLLAPLYEEAKAAYESEAREEEEEEEPIYFFSGDEKSFSFVTLKNEEICIATYYFEAGEKRRFMRIIKYQSKGYISKGDEAETLLADIENIEVSYSYESEDEDSPPIWLNIWEQEEKVPLGVKIKFDFKGLGTLRQFTKTVLVPVGSLGAQEESEI